MLKRYLKKLTLSSCCKRLIVKIKLKTMHINMFDFLYNVISKIWYYDGKVFLLVVVSDLSVLYLFMKKIKDSFFNLDLGSIN